MSARDGALKHGRIQMPAREKVIPGRQTHMHMCGHYDACYLPQFAQTTDCRRCVTERFNGLMAKRYREDSMSTKALLEERS